MADGADRVSWVDRQLPQGDEVFIDHVGYFVADLGAAGAQLERLGFRVSLTNMQTNADASGALELTGGVGYFSFNTEGKGTFFGDGDFFDNSFDPGTNQYL